MTSPTTRPALPSDMPQVAALRWTWLVEENSRPSDLGRDAFVRELVTWAVAHVATHSCFVAEQDGAVVGMAWLAITARVPSPHAVDRTTGDLQSVYVVPELRNRGIGSALVAVATRAAAEAGVERLVVHSSARAIPAYARAGFVSSERLRDLAL